MNKPARTSTERDTRAVTPESPEVLAAWERYIDALCRFHGITREEHEQLRVRHQGIKEKA